MDGYLGAIHLDLEAYQKAIGYFEKVTSQPKSHSDFKVLSFNGLASVYSIRNEHEKSIEYYRKSLDTYAQMPNKIPSTEGAVYSSMATAYMKMQQYDSAATYLKTAQKIYRNVYGDTGYYLSRSLLSIANFYVITENYDSAAYHLQNGLKALAPGFSASDFHVNPSPEKALSRLQLFRMLNLKAQIHDKFGHYDRAAAGYALSATIVKRVLAELSFEEDRLRVISLANNLFLNAAIFHYHRAKNGLKKKSKASSR